MLFHKTGTEIISKKCDVIRVQDVLQVCANYRTFSATAKFLLSNNADEALDPAGSKIQQQVSFISIF
jgi:hypothetical protein